MMWAPDWPDQVRRDILALSYPVTRALPTRQPKSVTIGYNAGDSAHGISYMASVPGDCASVDLLTCAAGDPGPGGAVQFAHVVHPSATFNGTIFYHLSGHGDSYYSLDSTRCFYMCQSAIRAGCIVVGIGMPSYGLGSLNNPFTTLSANGTRVVIPTTHDLTAVYAAGIPAGPLFWDPVFVAKNWIKANVSNVKKHVLGGLSGGGWWSLWAGALDPEFKISIAVNGWMPYTLRPLGRDGEQLLDFPPLAPCRGAQDGLVLDYSCLQVLAAHGAGRTCATYAGQNDPDFPVNWTLGPALGNQYTTPGDYRTLWDARTTWANRHAKGTIVHTYNTNDASEAPAGGAGVHRYTDPVIADIVTRYLT